MDVKYQLTFRKHGGIINTSNVDSKDFTVLISDLSFFVKTIWNKAPLS